MGSKWRKGLQVLYLPGDFSQPAPDGNIVSISFSNSENSAEIATNFNDLTIKLGQSTITS